MKSKIIAFVLIALAALSFTIPALAGGWAVITLESLPSGVVAGSPFTVRFAVRQHGRTLLADLAPTISAQNTENGDSFSTNARPVVGNLGHYEAVLTFPSAGNWEWAVQAFTMDQRMPDLVVAADSAISEALPEDRSRLPLLTGVAGVAIALVALGISLRSKSRLALSLVFLGLAVGIAGFVSTAGTAPKVSQPVPASQLAPDVAAGQALFIAKGCLSCHINNRVETKYSDFRSELGPNLTKYSASPEFLAEWLIDPASLRPNTEMPNLGLDEAEINALVAFLITGEK
jgi:cytochrome c2